jgi:hypothetical protein
MKYCCTKFEVDIKVPSTTSPNIRMVKFVHNPFSVEGSLYGFYITTGYSKFRLEMPKMTIAYCPYCGTRLKTFYNTDDYVNEFEGKTFLSL